MSIEQIGFEKITMGGEFPLKNEDYKGHRAVISYLPVCQTQYRNENGTWYEHEARDGEFYVSIQDPIGFEEEIKTCLGSPILKFLFGENWDSQLDKHLDPSDF
jgi:hypothetical protein